MDTTEEKLEFTLSVKKNVFGRTYISCIFADKNYIEYSAEKASDGSWRIFKVDNVCYCKSDALLSSHNSRMFIWQEISPLPNMMQAWKFLKANAQNLL